MKNIFPRKIADQLIQGKLSFSWPGTIDPGTLNVHDAEYDPLFPYGYGLTYTEQIELTELSENPGATTAVTSSSFAPDWRTSSSSVARR